MPLPLSIGRRFMKLYPAFFVLSLAATGVQPVAAQGFKPNKPIEFVVHTGPGGGNDLMARAIATIVDKEKLLPVRMQVVNKTGGSSATAMAYLVEKKAEAHTIAMFANLWFINPINWKSYIHFRVLDWVWLSLSTAVIFLLALGLIIAAWVILWKWTDQVANHTSDATSEPAPGADSSSHQG